MIDCDLVRQALGSYDPDAHEASVVKAEQQRSDFLELFPKQEWPAMTLDRYALGQEAHPENFCRWLEFVTTEVGSMRGGNAKKHLIYFRAGTGEWWFDSKVYGSVEEAWNAVRAGFVEAIAFAEAGEWEAIQNINTLRSGPALVNKMLSLYFPSDLLPINAQEHLRHFLRHLGDSRADDKSLGTTRLNRVLLEGLRTCKDLVGWTTKQMERLLYSSEISPFEAGQTSGPISDVASFIATTLAEAGDARLELRREAEDEARKLLDEFAGQMTEGQARALFKLFNGDFHKGRRSQSRFLPAFVGQTANALVANLQEFNRWTARIWKESEETAIAAVGELLANRKTLPSSGSSYPTMLMYLRSPEDAAVWLKITDQGLRRLTDYQPAKNPGNGGPDDYAVFCKAAVQLMADYDIPPELLDYLLAAAGRASEPKPEEADSVSGAWLFQANPTIYNIDQALSELAEMNWVVRQYKNDIHVGDRVYLWRSGADAGVIATATVAREPEVLPLDDSDPYVLRPEALSKPEPRVMLRIDSVLPAAIRRSDLVEHAVLNSLGVIAFANATNFKVTSEQDQALLALVSGFRIPPLRGEIEDRVHLPQAWLQQSLDLLAEKGQIVFYGPPGTGKTFVALALAEEITREGGEYRIVQFHPSYSYEDFVGGFRPIEDDGAHGIRYRRTNGPLRELAAAAEDDPSHPYVLVIDEINRGNIPKILGELLFLLEYRQKAVRLQYWPEEQFSLPKNLFLIGTMNTADRSIALVDAALRRRFYFVPFIPTEPPVSNVLDKWLAKHGHGDHAARILDLLNKEIARDEVAIGPSYFMTDPDAGPDLERIWDRGIMPLLEEYYYGTTWDADKFGLAKLKARLAQVSDEGGSSSMAEDDA
jgi:AAA domain (dynein-related subfamily)/EVE domain